MKGAADRAIRPDEIIVDLFAGGGGASEGIRQALGRHPDLAVNHDEDAIACHTANHPTTEHACASVWNVEPRVACAGRPVGLLWASPDCRHFSRAAGGRPKWKSVRALPGVVLTWATRVRPRVIVVENVREFLGWGPLLEDGRPCPDRIGRSFNVWVGRLRGLGYRVQWRELCAADLGAPTIRTRLIVVARCDDAPIVWPQPTHHRVPGLFGQPWRTAAEIIDWSLPCPSIFDRRRPLADKTLARVAEGVRRYVLDAAEPFVVSVTHAGGFRGQSLRAPLATVTCANRGEKALVVPTLVQTGYGERAGQAPRVPGLDKPLGTLVAGGGKHALVSAFLAGCGGRAGQSPPKSVAAPMNTITAKADQILVAAFVAQHNGGVIGRGAGEPVSTISTAGSQQNLVECALSDTDRAGAERVAAFMIRYNGLNIGQDLREPLGSVTSKPRFALVTVHGIPLPIADIGMRMLAVDELRRAQGFPDGYDLTAGGRLSKTAQIRLIGNSVVPAVAAAVVRANLASHRAAELAA